MCMPVSGRVSFWASFPKINRSLAYIPQFHIFQKGSEKKEMKFYFSILEYLFSVVCIMLSREVKIRRRTRKIGIPTKRAKKACLQSKTISRRHWCSFEYFREKLLEISENDYPWTGTGKWGGWKLWNNPRICTSSWKSFVSFFQRSICMNWNRRSSLQLMNNKCSSTRIVKAGRRQHPASAQHIALGVRLIVA